jgi:hypothetical protein
MVAMINLSNIYIYTGSIIDQKIFSILFCGKIFDYCHCFLLLTTTVNSIKMRTSTVLLLICIASSVFAAPNTSAKVIELLQSGSKAADAVDSALQVLYDLEAANSDAQDAADELNRTQQAAGEAEIEDLRQIAEANQASGNAATEHRKYLESEIADTEAYLEWIENRRAEIHAREEELQDQRCYSNSIFVRALKNLADGLQAIDLLRNDVLPAADRADGTVELVSIKDATKKLSAYKNLFNEQAIAEFEQLAGHVGNYI